MPRDVAALTDILNSARIALSYVVDLDESAFESDMQAQDAVVRRLEIIGEAARRVSESTRQMRSHLPWPQMIGMRNFVIHQYDVVDLKIVWSTVRNDLPGLITELEQILGGQQSP